MTKTKRGQIPYDRWTQIVNNVFEEYADLGQTTFATKTELCETIMALSEHQRVELGRKDEALDRIARQAFEARLYRSKISVSKKERA